MCIFSGICLRIVYKIQKKKKSNTFPLKDNLKIVYLMQKIYDYYK